MNSLKNLLHQAVTEQVTNGRRLSLGGNALQLCSPLISWNWEISPTGTISSGMFSFCNSVPAAPDADTFVAGGNFFDAYQGFLAWFNEHFFPQNTLLHLLRTGTRPIESPTTTAAPDGWVKVNDGGALLRWQPAYSVNHTPRQWRLLNQHEDAPTLTLPLNDIPLSIFRVVDGEGNDRIIDPERVVEVRLTAKAWDRIRISPGNWYDSSIVDQARLQPGVLKHDLKINRLVGADKLLSARISEILVVLEPVLHIITHDETTNQLLETTDATMVQVDDLAIEQPVVSRTDTPEGNTHWQLGSDPEQPYILGVFLEKFYRQRSNPPGRSIPVAPRAMPLRTPNTNPISPDYISGQFDGRLQLTGKGKYQFTFRSY